MPWDPLITEDELRSQLPALDQWPSAEEPFWVMIVPELDA